MSNEALSATTGYRYGRRKKFFGKFIGAFALASVLLGQSPAQAEDGDWIGTWMASPQPVWEENFALPTKIPATVEDQTFRQIVRISLGGSRVRFVFSNIYGERSLKIGSATMALAGQDGAIEGDTIRTLTFGGKDLIVIPPGAPAISDPVNMNVDAQARLVVSTYLPDETPLSTFHWEGRGKAWFGRGDLTRSVDFQAIATTDARILLSDVLVDTENDGAVIVIGDSITDGNGATVDADARWPDFLARRLVSHDVAVLNAGISGARLLGNKMGVNAVARLEQDVFARPNVRAIIVLIGINDISWPGTAFARRETRPTAEAMISGYQQLIALAQAHNVRVIGATLTPFEGALTGTPFADYYDADKDALRQTVNRWIRESGAFDAVVDFDAALRDPSNPARLAPSFDSGDHLHPGDTGNHAMAQAVDLNALLGR
ncbi:SGNH/GDSL hydrolase family protein [Pararhizobium sp. IMCC21322]|uniref:SGNH/GDSL hydrolase family protein n=1 Tax=Pararhizobium sp. IMCC21322 TaxID=3067903 RepID=UPI0027415142|nr:SGNH/GDSL hydrolase family protein [Pararhizobium sp. IMCC21322]